MAAPFKVVVGAEPVASTEHLKTDIQNILRNLPKASRQFTVLADTKILERDIKAAIQKFQNTKIQLKAEISGSTMGGKVQQPKPFFRSAAPANVSKTLSPAYYKQLGDNAWGAAKQVEYLRQVQATQGRLSLQSPVDYNSLILSESDIHKWGKTAQTGLGSAYREVVQKAISPEPLEDAMEQAFAAGSKVYDKIQKQKVSGRNVDALEESFVSLHKQLADGGVTIDQYYQKLNSLAESAKNIQQQTVGDISGKLAKQKSEEIKLLQLDPTSGEAAAIQKRIDQLKAQQASLKDDFVRDYGAQYGITDTKVLDNTVRGLDSVQKAEYDLALATGKAQDKYASLNTELKTLGSSAQEYQKYIKQFHDTMEDGSKSVKTWEEHWAASDDRTKPVSVLRAADTAVESFLKQYETFSSIDLSTIDWSTDDGRKKLSELQQTVRSYADVKTAINEVKKVERQWARYDALSEKLGKSAGNTKKFKDQLKALGDEFKAHPENLDAFSRGLTKVANDMEAAGIKGETAGERFSRMLGEKIGYAAIAGGLMLVRRALGQVYTNVVQLDTAMTELKKVTDETDAAYRKFLDNAGSRAQELGASLTDVVNASASFARLGYGLEDASKLADASIVYKNVGDGIETIDEASESIISTMQAFGVETNNVMNIVDKYNEVGRFCPAA